MISDLAAANARARIQAKIDACWGQVAVFADNRDAHGVMDLGVEIQALIRALGEIERAEKDPAL